MNKNRRYIGQDIFPPYPPSHATHAREVLVTRSVYISFSPRSAKNFRIRVISRFRNILQFWSEGPDSKSYKSCIYTMREYILFDWLWGFFIIHQSRICCKLVITSLVIRSLVKQASGFVPGFSLFHRCSLCWRGSSSPAHEVCMMHLL